MRFLIFFATDYLHHFLKTNINTEVSDHREGESAKVSLFFSIVATWFFIQICHVANI